MVRVVDYMLLIIWVYVMGVLNVMLDFFFDGGCYSVVCYVFVYVQMMIVEGVDILDIGVESIWLGFVLVILEEEWVCFVLVLEFVVELGVFVFIDIYKVEIVCWVCVVGVVIVNDVWGLQKDFVMVDMVVGLKVLVVMMYNCQEVDFDIDILMDIYWFFEMFMKLVDKVGILWNKQIFDLGFGFGKIIDQNFFILNCF